MGVKSQWGLSVCSNECELTEREGGEADNLHMWPVRLPLPVGWGERERGGLA